MKATLYLYLVSCDARRWLRSWRYRHHLPRLRGVQALPQTRLQNPGAQQELCCGQEG